ncbi:MAG: cbb3-type cytochrome c oxidase subunit 3 [Colwellia sp.]|nr:cbb3-type cytochrome c oxidase subunit 3 [Colwellia sp.]
MDYGTLRGLVALLIFALFIIIVIWSYSKKQKSAFDEAANSIFEEDKEQTDLNDVNSKQESNKNV